MAESKVVWSTDDPCPAIDILLEQCDDDIDKAIKVLAGKSCTYEAARQMSVAFSPCFGITEADFIKRWKKVFGWKRGA